MVITRRSKGCNIEKNYTTKKEPSIRSFKVSDELKEIVTDILKEENIPFHFLSENQIACDISGGQFHQVIEHALCVKEQGSSIIPVLSLNMLLDKNQREKYLKGKSAYHILKRDLEKFQNSIV